MRIILYTGKGGVGKTTVASATALRAAQRGYRTLILSTDPAHSLADSFDMELGSEPTPIVENLWGQEIDVLKELDEYWGAIQDWIGALLAWQGVSDLVASEVAVLPGMDELTGLLHIVSHYDKDEYDLLVVDCAPTGETLRLLSFPETARWYMEHIFPVERRATSLLRPVIRAFSRMPVPSEAVFRAGEHLFQQLDRMRHILADPERTSVRLVVNPEKMVVKEARRTYTYLNLYGYFTDLVIINRVLPEVVQDAYFDAWRASQNRNMRLIQESFDGLPVFIAPLMDQEVVGLEMLERLGEVLFRDQDPAAFQREGFVEQVTEGPGGYELTLALPFLVKEDVTLTRSGDELVVQAGQYRRNITLPRALAVCTVGQARMEDGSLRLQFIKQGPADKAR